MPFSQIVDPSKCLIGPYINTMNNAAFDQHQTKPRNAVEDGDQPKKGRKNITTNIQRYGYSALAIFRK